MSRKIVTVSETNELPLSTTFPAESAMENRVINLIKTVSPSGTTGNTIFVSSLEQVPPGTPADTIVVVV